MNRSRADAEHRQSVSNDYQRKQTIHLKRQSRKIAILFPIIQRTRLQHRKSQNIEGATFFTVAIAIIEGLLIVILVLAIWLFSLNGWTDQGMIGFVKGINTTPTPIPMPTYSPVPTPSPTPIIEYIYITPQPTNTPSPTPIPTAIPTPIIEYVYITPEPMGTTTPEIEYKNTTLPPSERVEINNSIALFGNARFGMSIEEVSILLSEQNIVHERKESYIELRASINGCEDSYVRFSFNDNEELRQVRYELPSFESADAAIKNYNELESRFLVKYGDTKYTAESGYGLVFREGRMVDGRKGVFGFYANDTIPKRAERIVDYDDGTHIIIDHYCIITDFEFNDEMLYQHIIVYELYVGNIPLVETEYDSQQTFDEL